MAVVTNFVVRVSGTVAYTDNTSGSFEAVATQRGNLGNIIAQHSNSASQEHFRQLYTDQSTGINAMLAFLPGTVTVTTPAAAVPKDVSSFVMEISGTVAFNDNTKGYFIVQWVDGALDLYPATTDAAWSALTGNATTKSFLDSVLEGVAGAGRVAIS